MDGERASSWPRKEALPWLISGLGVFFLLAFFAEAAVFSGLDPAHFLTQEVTIAFLVMLPFVAGLTYGGYWLARGPIEPDRYPRAAKWCFGGALGFLGLNLPLIAGFAPDSLWITVGWARGTATMGSAAGLLVGIIEARAIQHALVAERSELRADHLETQREWLDYLNGLLRHEILNTAQVINGYTKLLVEKEGLEEETRSRLRAIRRQSDDMTAVIRDVRLLIEATHDEATLRPVDLSDVICREVQDLRDAYESVDVEKDVAEDLTVRADDLLPRVFSNLLANAVEHNDGDVAHVTVNAESRDGTAVVRVEDDGPGVPEDRRGELFDRKEPTRSDHGIGLYLVGLLVDRYDGMVELTETGPTGSVFTVELPLADEDAPSAGSGRPESRRSAGTGPDSTRNGEGTGEKVPQQTADGSGD